MNTTTQQKFRLSVGPVLGYWPRRQLLDFYAGLADSPAHSVSLGEVVCSRRHEMKLDDWLALARELAAAGKEVVLATQALIESEAELRTMHRLAEHDEFLLEANDAAAVAAAAGRRFVVGAHINVYSRAALEELAAIGAVRWVPPLELPLEAIGLANPRDGRCAIESELFAFGRMPLAISARCFTARHYGLNRDDCGFRCIEHPDGLTLRTQDGDAFLALNGQQTLSARLMCALGERERIAAAGITRLRLSPTSRHFVEVVDAYDRVFNHGEDAATALESLRAVDLPGKLANGYLLRKPGFEWSRA